MRRLAYGRPQRASQSEEVVVSVGTAFHLRTAALNTTMSWGEWSGYFAAASRRP
jgi:hypothetical protein